MGVNNHKNMTVEQECPIISGTTNVQDAINFVSGRTLETKLQYLANCKCCKRHQTRKPKKLGVWKDCTSASGLNQYEKMSLSCRCECRHIARFICRRVN